jgi:hypothetical protein
MSTCRPRPGGGESRTGARGAGETPGGTNNWGRGDLCVRSAGLGSEEDPSDGQAKDLDRNLRCATHRDHPSQGSSTRPAGGRTSVSAPLGLGSEEDIFAGQPKALDRNLRCAPHQVHPSQGASTRLAGGADLCVRSAGCGSEENFSLGSPKTWIDQHLHPDFMSVRSVQQRMQFDQVMF